MNPAQCSRRVSFSSRPLLLADLHRPDRDRVDHASGVDHHRGVDVVVVDLDGVEPAAVEVLVVEAAAFGHLVGGRGGSMEAVDSALQCGVSLVVLDESWPDSVIRAIVDAGAVVVLPAGLPDAVSARATTLLREGVDLTRVVFEVCAAQVVHQVETIVHLAEGYRAGVCLAPGDGSLTHDGWEVGVLTAVLSQGVATVRGVDPRRFHRVCSVLDALNGLEPVS